MTKPKVTAEVFDEDEVLITLSGVVDDEGEEAEDIELRIQLYEDTPTLALSIETSSEIPPVVELSSSKDIKLKFESYASLSENVCDCCGDELCECDDFCADDDLIECDEDCTCQCDEASCDCQETDVCDSCCFFCDPCCICG